MPLIRAVQLVGKTIRLNKQTPFYRVSDINKLGDSARPVSNMLPEGYQFVISSFLTSGPAYTSGYGIKYAARKDNYITFYGNDRQYYAIKSKDIQVGKQGLKEAGIKSVKQEAEQEKLAEMSDIERIAASVGKYAKWIVIGVAAVWATGYLIKTTRK